MVQIKCFKQWLLDPENESIWSEPNYQRLLQQVDESIICIGVAKFYEVDYAFISQVGFGQAS